MAMRMFSTTVAGSILGGLSADPNWKGVAGGGGGASCRFGGVAAVAAAGAGVEETVGLGACGVASRAGTAAVSSVGCDGGVGVCPPGRRRKKYRAAATQTSARTRTVFALRLMDYYRNGNVCESTETFDQAARSAG